ncbi:MULTISPECIES: M4 family metallopeptidase [unclassified Streptomyces]|uniref:M4 family metallopeptidase n=1 Tax=unclassified Streptomyces TaxID=2593676 RepID=UPI001660E6DB|nr:MULTISPECIES: M4 family metallopeptidase [unclassified Streptomyces]MBD0708089.1 peptidase M4 family protein [Streptomyces sp. CBMA291]MBD0715817.1 peptidase M4 family protein [Streptomyces sp. CBMA370]
MTPQRPVFCSIVPPHLLEHLSRSSDPEVAAVARRTLVADASARTFRGLPPSAAVLGADAAGHPHRTIHDCKHRTTLPGTKVRGEGDAASADATVNRAYAGLGATFDLYLNAYGHDSIDGAGLPLNASVHYDRNYGNAFWNGEQMVFGDGDGAIFLDFTLPVDVIGHELTHGFTQYGANLEYYGQSGALNESVSDVFGVLVKQHALGQSAEQADWLIGEGLFGPDVEGTALRSMKAPGTAYDDDVLGKDPQPGHMDDYVRTSRDNGGVHINSGIPNHAFYLAATELGGNAWERAGQIWYDVMTNGSLAPEARFTEFAAATVAAARARYGDGAEIQAVLKAWSTVGVPTG